MTSCVPFIASDGSVNQGAGPLGGSWEAVGTESPNQKRLSQRESRLIVKHLVPSEQLFDFRQSTLGYSYSGGSSIGRVRPANHPEFLKCYATEIVAEVGCIPGSETSSEGLQHYQYYEVFVMYEALDYLVHGGGQDRTYGPGDHQQYYLRVQQRDASQLVGINARTYEFDETDRNIDIGQHLALPITQFLVTWLEVPVIYVQGGGQRYDRLATASGKINSDTFLGFDAKTLLFIGYSEQRYTNYLGTLCSDITLAFDNRNSPNWNQFFDYDGTIRGLHNRLDPTNKPFVETPFANLFLAG